jgi:hypothetical protein
VGDLTSTLFRSRRDSRLPALPDVPLTPIQAMGNCKEVDEESEFGGAGPTIPTKQRMPTQRGTTVPASRYLAESPTATPRAPLRSGRKTATARSAYLRLAEPD